MNSGVKLDPPVHSDVIDGHTALSQQLLHVPQGGQHARCLPSGIGTATPSTRTVSGPGKPTAMATAITILPQRRQGDLEVVGAS